MLRAFFLLCVFSSEFSANTEPSQSLLPIEGIEESTCMLSSVGTGSAPMQAVEASPAANYNT